MKRFLLSILFLIISEINVYSQGIGNGSDGSPNISGIVNSYSSVTNISSNSCQSILTVNTNLGFSVGDLVLIIQIQGAAIDTTNTSNYGLIQNDFSSGLFEYSRIISISGNIITLNSIITNTYQINGKVQLIKVPQYISPVIVGTLTCLPWNGNTGGVLAIDAIGKITFSDSIDVSGKGFRGGQIITVTTNPAHVFNYYSSYNPSMYASKGEGISGYGLGSFIYGKGSPANGGGGGNSVNAGGGGGGSFGCGGDGGHAFNTPIYGSTPNLAAGFGGKQLNYSTLRACLGGGGGAAHENDNHAYDGGNGGGIVIITSDSINGASNKINSNGMTALNSTNDGGSGGGGGGSILINCMNYSTPIYLNLKGGDGASTTDVSGYQHGGGGGGGGGLIWISQTTKPINMFINQNGGLGGLASGANSGSTSGCLGGNLFNLNLSFISSVNINSSTTLTICQNDTITLSINSSAQFINWLPITNLSCTNCTSPKAYPSNNTTYIVTDSVNHCFNSDTFIIKVNLKSFSSIYDSICQGNIFISPSGKHYLSVGIYHDTIMNHIGCDSIITIHLAACTNTFSLASFQFIDSTCIGVTNFINNTSSNNLTNCWSFDSLNINGVKSSVNLGVLNNTLVSTTAGTLVEDAGNYYLFITNSFTTDLIRCDLGINPLNTIPLSTTVISNVLPGGHNEAVQFFKENGNWYAIVDGGAIGSAFMSRLNFGASITNTAPTVIQLSVPILGNWPHQLEIFKNNSNYIGFVVCRTNGDVQRIDFGNSITNTPIITTVYSSLNPSVGYAMEQENGNWYMMISTNNAPGDLRILNFGTNILNNSPTVTNLGNVGGLLDAPRAIKLFKSCNQLFGLVSSQKSPTLGYPGHIVLLNFQKGITSPITATNLGNYGGNDDFWNMTSNTFWSNNAFHFFTFNPVDTNVTRIDITPSGNTLPLSFSVNPSIQYSTGGNHNIQLLTNFGNINQSNYCSSHFSIKPNSTQNISICQNDTAVLQLNAQANHITWNPTTNISCISCISPKAYPSNNTMYIATDSINHCFSTDTFYVKVSSKSFATINASICQGSLYYSPTGNVLTSNGIYYDTINNHNGCDSIITINLSVINKSTDSIYTVICQGTNYTSPGGKVFTATGIYQDTIPNHNGCDSIITIQLTTLDSSLTIIRATICQGDNYTLPDGTNVNSSGTYYIVYVSNARCDSTLQFEITVLSNSTSNQTLFLCEGDTAHLPDGTIALFSGNYFSTLSNYKGCDSIILTVINMLPKFKIDLGSDVLECDDKTIILNANPNNLFGGEFSWNNDINLPTIEVRNRGLYIVTATFAPCKPVSDSILITTKNCNCNIDMPNAFSPNHDNLNETIKPIIDCFPLPFEYEFSIYNRWGQKVFSTSNPDECWDGTYKNKEQEVGVYDFIINYKHFYNSPNTTKKGDITLIR